MTELPAPPFLRSALALLIAAAVGAAIVAFTGVAGLTGSLLWPGAAAGASAAAVARWLWRHPALRPADAPARGVRLLSTAGSLVVIVQLVRLTVFVLNPAATGWSTVPWNGWIAGHSCVTAYWAAARGVGTLPDVYGEALYLEPRADATAPPLSRTVGGFNVDPYEYPPTFLVLPRALALVAPEFLDFRRLWFALNLAAVVAGLVAIARRLEGAVGPSALWLTPLALVPLSMTSTLQVGNFQLACVAIAMLGMLALERRPTAAGSPVATAAGALALAYATVSKLYPGVLIVYLLLRRDWRAVAWTAASAAALGLVGLADFGWAPHAAFLDHLPRLLSGEAFAALVNPRGVAGNMSVPGIVFKLGVVYGVPGMSFDAARIVGWIYTAAMLGITARLAFRPLARAWEPLAWLAILLLATLRSPLLPPYGAFPALWMATVVLAAWWKEPRARVTALLVWLIFVPVTPNQTLLPPTVHALVTFAQTMTALILVAIAISLRRRDAV